MFQVAQPATCQDPLDHLIQQDIQRLVDDLLKSGRWAAYHHPLLDELRQAIASTLAVNHVRLCPSGSAAIELALRACHLQAGDEVICAALDYPGNLRAIRVLDLQPVIVDVAAERFTLSVSNVANAASAKTRAVLVSHLYGDIAPVDQLRALCDAEGWLLIEDVCQMPGASLGDGKLGAYGHVSAFSFGGNKPITAGAGGAVATSDARIVARMNQYVDRPSDSLTISPLQAAVLLPQWHQLDALTKRQQQRLQQWLSLQDQAVQAAIPLRCLPTEQTRPVFYKLPIDHAQATNSDFKLGSTNLLGQIFQPHTKVLPGRGRLCSSEHAVRMHAKYGLLDVRLLLGN